MLRWNSFALYTFLVACTAVSMAHAQSEARSNDYAVYSVIIGQKFIKSEIRLAVIRDETLADSGDTVHIAGNFRDLSQRLMPQETTLDDYKKKNKAAQRLDRAFDLPVPYLMLTAEDNQKIFRGDANGWKRFYQKYPASFGFVSFSAVGYNNERNQALVYVVRACGSLCASGQYVLLAKTDGEWKIDKEIMMWVS